jgi:hypothetical protein
MTRVGRCVTVDAGLPRGQPSRRKLKNTWLMRDGNGFWGPGPGASNNLLPQAPVSG